MSKILIGCFDIPPNTDEFSYCEDCLCSDGVGCDFNFENYKVYNEVV